MTRNLMASTALLALVTAGTFGLAHAQTQPAQTDQPAAVEQPAAGAAQGETTSEATAEALAAPAEPTLTPDEPTIASAFMGRAVFSSEAPESDNIGEVNDLIIGNDGMITHAVVGVGGFLGIGEKDVAVPFDELRVVEEEDGEIRLIYAATKEQLEAAEGFDRTAYDPRARAAEAQQAEADAGLATDGTAITAPGAVVQDPAAGVDTAMAPAPAATDTQTEPAATVEPADTTEPAVTAEPAATTEPAVTAGATTEPATTTEPTATAGATTEPATATEPAGTAETDAATTETTVAVTTPEPAAGGAATTSGEGGFVSFSADQMRASRVMGQEIYGADNESIGEVSDLVLQEDGTTRAAIVDVGGFLGVGEKSVAIPFDQLTMTPSEGGTEARVSVAMTREQLEAAPAFEARTMDADQAAVDPAAQPAAGTDTAMTAPATTTDPNAPAATTTIDPNMAAQQTAAAQFEPVTQELSADDLMGSVVIGSNEENLGEVGDVVFDPNGGIQAVVVDVGGFLGIGEKPVAVQFDSLNVQKNGNDDFRLMVNATQEQLENAPAYNEDAAEAGQAQPAVQ